MPGEDILSQEELFAMRRQLTILQGALQHQYRLNLVVDPASYLGESVTIKVAAQHLLDQTPAPAVDLIFCTTWGVLESDQAGTDNRGQSLRVQTGSDGTASLRLLPPGFDRVPINSRRALHAMAGRLNGASATPAQEEQPIRDLVQAYRWASNAAFRSAVDHLFRILVDDARPERLGAVMTRWSHFESCISVQAVAGNGNSSHGAAMARLRLRNWLLPWLHLYRQILQEEPELNEGFDTERKVNRDPGRLAQGLSQQAQVFAEKEQGDLGAVVASHVAARSLRQATGQAFENFDPATSLRFQQEVDHLDGQLRTSGLVALERLGQSDTAQTRNLVSEAVNRLESNQIAGLNSRLDALGDDLNKKLDASALTPVVSRLGDMEVNIGGRFTGLEDQLLVFDQALANKAETVTLNQVEGRLNGQINQRAMAADFNRFTEETKVELERKLNTTQFSAFESQTRADLNDKLETQTFNEFETQTQQTLNRKVNTSTFKNFRSATETNLENKLETQTFQDFEADNKTNLSRKVNNGTFNSFRNSTQANLNSKLATETFEGFRAENAKAIAEKVDTGAFTRLRKTITDNLNRVAEEVRGFEIIDLGILRPTTDTVLTPIDRHGPDRPGPFIPRGPGGIFRPGGGN